MTILYYNFKHELLLPSPLYSAQTNSQNTAKLTCLTHESYEYL